MILNTSQSYGSITKFLHWFIALCVILLYSVAHIMINLGPNGLKWQLYTGHKSLGFTVFILMVIRSLWRILNKQPSLDPKTPKWDKLLSNATIGAFYVLLFVMPISGVLLSLFNGHSVHLYWLYNIPPKTQGPTLFGWFAHEAHVYISYLGFLLFTGHVSGALYHHFHQRDNVLRRMLPHRK